MDIFNKQYTLEEWTTIERDKTLNLFLEHEYGYCPLKENEKIEYKEVSSINYEKLISKKIEMKYKEHKMYFNIYIPNNNLGPFKTFLTLVHPYAERNTNFFSDYKTIEKFCPIDYLIENNFAVVLLSLNTIAEDIKETKQTGIFKVISDKSSSNTSGLISMWSWGARRAIDYLEKLEYIDNHRLAVIGHSRGGKTALLTGATDERVVLTISNNSGNSGAALSRNNKGERIRDIMTNFPYWFCDNYNKYVDNEDNLPFDQHILLGLIAPRYLYVASALEDNWADPKGELLSSKLATKFYEMYNVKGLIIPNEIEINKSYNEGNIAYHIREGKHGLTLFDWQCYVEYFNKIK